MTLSTTTAAFNLTPVVINTFAKHYAQFLAKEGRRVRGKKQEDDITDDILFDEAFHIVKGFLQLGMDNRVEDLQSFTNTHIPAPFWTTVIPVLIPLSSCNAAADTLISHFTSDEIERVVGGERWWQVRGLDGVEAEWVAMKSDWQRTMREKKKGRTAEGVYDASIDRLDRVMLYIHGGGYYFGSINTHRYQITRFARKMGGRAFAVNYRKAPQYPWPCPLQDCLAAYLYLIDPPPGAPHSAVDPRHIVIAGDSAGGGIALALLAVIRGTQRSPLQQPTLNTSEVSLPTPNDPGRTSKQSSNATGDAASPDDDQKHRELPMPSGAVLISPWVDLTHSFPSVVQNTATDIIPTHGFIHKPSTLWPVPVGSDRTERSKTREVPHVAEATASESTRKWPSLRKKLRSGSHEPAGVLENHRVVPISDTPHPNDAPSSTSSTHPSSPSSTFTPSHSPQPTSSSSRSGTPNKIPFKSGHDAPLIGVPTDTVFTSVKRRGPGDVPFALDPDVQGTSEAEVHGEEKDALPSDTKEAEEGENEAGGRFTAAPDPQSAGRSPENPPLIKVPFTPKLTRERRRSIFWGKDLGKKDEAEEEEQKTVELKAQIQLYATNEQLSHPLVSPLLQPSLGGLPPLYILTGDRECLRDEIIYLAHRCAEPKKYKLAPRLAERARKDGGGEERSNEKHRDDHEQRARAAEMDALIEEWDYTPTQVHLQVFDGMCHVPTVFTFCDSPKYAYRSIATFIKHVTKNSSTAPAKVPSTLPHSASAPIVDGMSSPPPDGDPLSPAGSSSTPFARSAFPNTSLGQEAIASSPGIVRYAFFGTDTAVSSTEDLESTSISKPPVEDRATGMEEGSSKSKNSSLSLFRRRKPSRSSPAVVQSSTSSVDGDKRLLVSSTMALGGQEVMRTDSPAPIETDASSLADGSSKPDLSQGSEGEASSASGRSGQVIMKRERVDVRGRVRPMEPAEEIPALQMDPERIGTVAEAPVKRWLEGQDMWDRRYRRTAERVERERKKNEWIAEEVLKHVRGEDGRTAATVNGTRANVGHRWGPLDLEDEHPPPSAIAGRRDNPDSLALLKVSVDYTHQSLVPVPPVLPSNMRETLERTLTRPGGAGREPTRQSAAEQQVKSFPMHGLNIWSGIAGHFTDRTRKDKDADVGEGR